MRNLVVVILMCAGLSAAQKVARGPYLQQGSATGMVVRWRTDVPTTGVVRYGSAPDALKMTVTGPAATDHEVKIDKLQPGTRYFYSIGTPDATLVGGDSRHAWMTMAPVGDRRPLRVWVLGDSGTKDAAARAVRDGLRKRAGTLPHLWLMLGDNAYENGNDAEYQAAVFENMYEEILRAAPLFSTRGNHENHSDVYYKIFTHPTAGEAGGVASGTEAYYSFDAGNVHFICLDSQGSDRSASGPMATWLRADLAATKQEWIVAFWHHPPYSKGSHNSDGETQLVQMRERFLPILEKGGVDLVLSGHSHSYERSMLVDGHYGISTQLKASMIVDSGDGRPDGDGAYRVDGGGHHGTVYTVAGSSGKISKSAPKKHPVMVTSLLKLGALMIDVHGDTLLMRFVDTEAVVRDSMMLLRKAGPTAVRQTAGVPVETLQASLETVATGRRLVLTAAPPAGSELTLLSLTGLVLVSVRLDGATTVPLPETLTLPPGQVVLSLREPSGRMVRGTADLR